MKKKNILFISSWFPNKLEPTNGNFVQRHAEAVSVMHNVEILHAIGDFSQKTKFVVDDRKINNIRTVVVYYKKSKNTVINFSRRMRAYSNGFQLLSKPDLLHANVLQKPMLFAVYLKLRRQIPFVISEHWSYFLRVNQSKLSFSDILTARFIAKHASDLMPVSKILAESMMNLNIGKSFSVVGNVVDTDLFYPQNKNQQPFVFLHISNLIPLKNPDAIIASALKLRKDYDNFELHIGGDGNFERLEKIVKENNATDFITVFGEISHQHVTEKMRRANCFILFSDYESFSCVLLESLASGTPVIATNVGAIPEMIQKNQGIIIEKSEDELFEAIKKMLEGRFQADSSENLHQYVAEKFSIKRIAQMFDDVYKRIV